MPLLALETEVTAVAKVVGATAVLTTTLAWFQVRVKRCEAVLVAAALALELAASVLEYATRDEVDDEAA